MNASNETECIEEAMAETVIDARLEQIAVVLEGRKKQWSLIQKRKKFLESNIYKKKLYNACKNINGFKVWYKNRSQKIVRFYVQWKMSWLNKMWYTHSLEYSS